MSLMQYMEAKPVSYTGRDTRDLEQSIEQCRKQNAQIGKEAEAEFIRRYRQIGNGDLKDAFNAALAAVVAVECAYEMTKQDLPKQSDRLSTESMQELQGLFLTGKYKECQRLTSVLHEEAKRLPVYNHATHVFVRSLSSARGPIKNLRDTLQKAADRYTHTWAVLVDLQSRPKDN